jgi:aldehyde dehydrogenase (NAD+)
MADVVPFLLAGAPRSTDEAVEVRTPYDGELLARVAVPAEADVESALASAQATREAGAALSAATRAEALAHVSRRLVERRAEVSELIVREGGKPWKWAAAEADRAAVTFRWAAEEARRIDGEMLRLDTDGYLGSRLGLVRRFPAGVVLGITPFNFPVNLVAHKLAPALAAGCPTIIKPAPATPLGALLLGDLVAETDLPPGLLSVLPLPNDRASALVTDDRVAHVSFTGSTAVGWSLKAAAPRKRFTLELGGNAAAVVHSDADLDHAVARIVFGGYYQAGQSCVSVQRVLVHEDVYDGVLARLAASVEKLQTGDPMDRATDVGPLINRAALDRVAAWVDAAVADGATAVVGGHRRDPFYEPTLLVDVPRAQPAWCEEMFGPVVALASYRSFDEAVAEVNASPYGLQAGVFSRDLDLAFRAHARLEVGGVIVNDVSAFRADQMPYGGVKASGEGREGLRYAIEAMTEPRILVLSGVPL